ncbi:MAG: 50S ribosomal protein L5 [uncultured bacterium]|nr:MAG: 50S ribosomal protein L5 [uncultured bacterium]OGJ47974.1 MAG: 50S ribosomal protein L5 [Candidatus Peregrinibacteria bacterium RIFOXYB12_FULL_41_12]OGJ48482.1 MAG: 50S ribosomal protein L5 [Candidatus Peregrinibacteria bacterium RIFOXYA2_FULL_41_18]OGJ52511.1 MAG: 50S ribosomal protein L5 [Candidatus Peregrinibacteria bacterium RIFOXYC2_FULL_41_22]OGJ55372.1 MAG: 50S ribosomal protein L5 [Candidatus Peregrinibacteria bacterium RIFOXYB2_FULL_41_88]
MATKAKIQTVEKKEMIKHLKDELNVKNILALPKLLKVKVNVGIGTYIRAGGKDFTPVVKNITDITGQKPIVTKSRKAISNFHLRAKMPVGVSVTLRKHRMNDFINKLVNVALPRTRDFRGISVKGFDGMGNYNLGIKDINIFPEISLENIDRPHGLQITIATSAKNNYEGYVLLKALGFPFKDEIKSPSAK